MKELCRPDKSLFLCNIVYVSIALHFVNMCTHAQIKNFSGERGFEGYLSFGGSEAFWLYEFKKFDFSCGKITPPPPDPRTVHLYRVSINHHILYNGIFLMDPKSDSCQWYIIAWCKYYMYYMSIITCNIPLQLCLLR